MPSEKSLLITPMLEEFLIYTKGRKDLQLVDEGLGVYSLSDGLKLASVGIGSFHMLWKLPLIIKKYSPKKVVLLGCAGAISTDLSIGDIVVPSVIYDFDVLNSGAPILSEGTVLPPYMVRSWNPFSSSKCVVGVSTDGFVRTVNVRERIQSKVSKFERLVSPMFVDMESFQFAQVCSNLGVEFIVVRQISDIAGGDSAVSVATWARNKSKKKLVSFVDSVLI